MLHAGSDKVSKHASIACRQQAYFADTESKREENFFGGNRRVKREKG